MIKGSVTILVKVSAPILSCPCVSFVMTRCGRAHETSLARRGVMSAMSLSLHEAFGEDLPGRQARGSHTPDLSLIDPCIVLGRGGEADVCEDVEHRLAGSRRRLAAARQRDPVAVLAEPVSCIAWLGHLVAI